MTISYLIFACNEHKELEKLLNKLTDFVQEPNEIMVILDDDNTTPEVYKVVEKFENEIGCYAHKLNGDFASHKNFGNLCCKSDWIFQIDADEIPNDLLIEKLPDLLNNNPHNEVFLVPRVNTVSGLTQEHIDKWRWNVDKEDRVNWPDYQWRIWKNKPEIKWVNKVHEKLQGFKTYSPLPALPDLALYHPKDIKRQEKQNNYYNTLT